MINKIFLIASIAFLVYGVLDIFNWLHNGHDEQLELFLSGMKYPVPADRPFGITFTQAIAYISVQIPIIVFPLSVLFTIGKFNEG